MKFFDVAYKGCLHLIALILGIIKALIVTIQRMPTIPIKSIDVTYKGCLHLIALISGTIRAIVMSVTRF